MGKVHIRRAYSLEQDVMSYERRMFLLAERIRHERGFRVREDGVVCRIGEP